MQIYKPSASSSPGLWLGLILVIALVAACALMLHAQEPKPTASPAQNTMQDSNTTTVAANTDNSKLSKEELKKKLTAEQYSVTCEAGTEPPFRNAYWNNHKAGIYVDVISGKPLFSSLDKFESGTGWPSFTKPLVKENVKVDTDTSFGMSRDEVKSTSSDAHLGHVFDDGPAEAGGMRYCMNSASLRFVPVEDLDKEGYGQYKALFANKK